MKPLPVDPAIKVAAHVDALFGESVSNELDLAKTSFEFSRKTGRIKNFSVDNKLAGTLRTDGGIAITLFGAGIFFRSNAFRANCVVANQDAVPFVSEGRSLFCKHVIWCGSNVRVGSDVAVLDPQDSIIAVGVAIFSVKTMMAHEKGVAVRIREGIKGRTEQTRSSI